MNRLDFIKVCKSNPKFTPALDMMEEEWNQIKEAQGWSEEELFEYLDANETFYFIDKKIVEKHPDLMPEYTLHGKQPCGGEIEISLVMMDDESGTVYVYFENDMLYDDEFINKITEKN